MVIALPFLAGSEQQPLEDDLTVHLKKYLNLILLLLIHIYLHR